MITITETVQVVVVDVAGPHTATEVATAMHKHNPAWKQWVRAEFGDVRFDGSKGPGKTVAIRSAS